MKRKLLTLFLLLVTVFGVFAIINVNTVEAATPTLYLTPNSNWKVDNARFAAYFFGNGEKWVSMTKVEGETDLYSVEVPAGYPNVIFCRMNPSASANNWDNKWNQTADLKVPTDGTNHYTVKDGTWDKGGGTWSTYGTVEELETFELLNNLYAPYYNNGFYTRKTVINIDMTNEDVKKDLYYAFHARSFYTERTTYFYPGELWMTNDEGTINSGYGTNSNNKMYHFSYVDGIQVVDYTVEDSTGMETWYTTLNDIKVTKDQNWTVDANGVYKSSDASLIKQFLDFTAPCFYNFDETNTYVFTLSHVTMQEVNGELVMKLYVSEDTKGFIKDNSTLLSTATISKSNTHTLAGEFNGWNVNGHFFRVTDVANTLYCEMDLTAASYKFKYLANGEWYGNNGTINDTTEGIYWEFKTAEGDCTLTAAGGRYVFRLNPTTNAIEVYKG